MTKYLCKEIIEKHNRKLSVEFPDGRAETAPALHSLLSTRALWEQEETQEYEESDADALLTAVQQAVNTTWWKNWKRYTKERAKVGQSYQRNGVVSSGRGVLGKELKYEYEPPTLVSDTPWMLVAKDTEAKTKEVASTTTPPKNTTTTNTTAKNKKKTGSKATATTGNSNCEERQEKTAERKPKES